MSCVARLVLGFALCGGLLGPVAAAADAAGVELQARRQAIADRFEREQVACRQRFAVNACLDAAQARHRQALKDVQARQEAADLQQRQGRAAARQAEIDRKDKLLADRPLTPPPDAQRADLRRVDAAALPGQASVPRPTPAPPSTTVADRAAARAKAAERAEAAKRLQAEIRADQARIQERLARRAAQGKKSAPLPEPEARPSRAPAASASAPG